MGFFSGTQDIFESVSAEQVAELIREQGFAPELDKTPSGKPVVKFLIEGMRSGIYFYGEAPGKPGHFTSIQFASGFRDKISLEKANQWNRERRFVKVFADGDGELALDMDVDLDGGVTRKFLVDKAKLWRSSFLACIRFV